MTRISRRITRGKANSSSDGASPPNDENQKSKTRIAGGRYRNFNLIFKMLSVSVIFIFIVGFCMNNYVLNPVKDNIKHRVVTPFPAPKLMDLDMFDGEHKEDLYWGTYRPHVYFGVRARTPQSLVAGLMWLGVKDGRYAMRHVCENSDDLKSYGWTHHNGRDYGRQVLVDQQLTLTTSFLKSRKKESGYGGDWTVRIEAESKISNEETGNSVHLFFYVADEGETALSLGRGTMDNPDDHVMAFGSRNDVGSWQLNLESEDDFEYHYAGFKTPHIHNLSDLVQINLAIQARKTGRLELSDTSDDAPNIIVFQISAVMPFKVDFAFLSGSGGSSSKTKERIRSVVEARFPELLYLHISSRKNVLVLLSSEGDSLSSSLAQKQEQFDEKFQKCFNMSDELDSLSVSVSKAALGNLLGGIGYFYGQSKISVPSFSNLEHDNKYISYWPAELYSAVPSRPFFPRGFLWDEGFHQLLIWRWDVRITLDILGHWLDLMNADGWIPREQILGPEALSKVPSEFVHQYPTNGNPPTLFLVLRDLLCGIKKNMFAAAERKDISIFLRQAFVRLDAWFNWFNTTQSGKDMNTFFWHGRDNITIHELNPKSLSSGLDDYPRASHPSEDERHLDLRCWLHLAADCMRSISEFLEDDVIGKEYGLTAERLSDFELLNQMHLDYANGAYFDYGNHSEKVRLNWRVVDTEGGIPSRELVREVLEKPVPRLVPHVGYVSLFPFMGRLIPPDSWILEKQLDLISNSSTLWTNFGLRSLSKTSSVYMKRNTEHDPPYWRGPIWMNMNYLILSALHHYSQVDGPYGERAKIIYNDLRNNLIRNVVRNYNRTGFLWEQYDQTNGKGKGARLFTGWSSLILLIMAEAYNDC